MQHFWWQQPFHRKDPCHDEVDQISNQLGELFFKLMIVRNSFFFCYLIHWKLWRCCCMISCSWSAVQIHLTIDRGVWLVLQWWGSWQSFPWKSWNICWRILYYVQDNQKWMPCTWVWLLLVIHQCHHLQWCHPCM